MKSREKREYIDRRRGYLSYLSNYGGVWGLYRQYKENFLPCSLPEIDPVIPRANPVPVPYPSDILSNCPVSCPVPPSTPVLFVFGSQSRHYRLSIRIIL